MKKLFALLFSLCTLLICTALTGAAELSAESECPFKVIAGTWYPNLAAAEAAMAGGEAMPKETTGGTGEAMDSHITVEPSTFGNGRGPAMISVIDTVFGYDLSSFRYVSHTELCTEDPISSENLGLRHLLIDIYIAAKEGDFIPLGFLCEDTIAYTVVEQPDGTLALTKYLLEVCPVGDTFSLGYQVLDTQIRSADRAVIDSLYS